MKRSAAHLNWCPRPRRALHISAGVYTQVKGREAQVAASRAAAAVARSLMEPEADGDSRELGTAALWWVRSFEQAPDDDTELRQTARANLAALSGRLHSLREVRTGPPVSLPDRPVPVVSPKGWVAEASGNRVRVTHAERSKVQSLEHDDIVRAMAILPDDRLLTGGDDHGARVWELTQKGEWRQVTTVEHQEYVRTMAVSPDGRLMVTGGADGVVQVWDTVTFRRVGQRLPHVGSVERVAFSADGTELTAVTTDGTERVWALSHAARTDRVCQLGSDVFAVAPAPDGTTLYAGTKSGLYRLDAANPTKPGQLIHGAITWAVAVHPHDEWVAAGGPMNTQAGKIEPGWFAVFRPNVKTHGPFDLNHPVRSIAVTPNGSQAFITSATATEGETSVWNAVVSNPNPLGVEPRQPAWAVAVTPDGGSFVTSTGDGRLRGREVDAHAPTGFFLDRPPRVVALAFHPDGRWLSTASTDGIVRTQDAKNGQQGWEARHRGAVWAVSVSPDGKRVVSGGRDRCVRVWDATTGRAVGPPLEHKAVVWAVAISPDGRWVWSGSEDGTVRRRLAPSATLDVPDDRLRLWAERAIGVRFDPQHPDRTRPLTTDEWRPR
jgi:WD40 repeat protein